VPRWPFFRGEAFTQRSRIVKETIVRGGLVFDVTKAAKGVSLARFVPLGLVERLSNEEGLPRAITFEGVALFADISGYTELTRQLCDSGAEGLGKLSALLGESFSRSRPWSPMRS
jgi:hypothetical protein